MKAAASFLCVSLLSVPVCAQSSDADAQAALLAVQRRNAGIVENLVDQTPSYQQGYSLRLEAVKQREAAQRAASRQQRAQNAPRLSREDQAALDNLNSDLNRNETSGGTRASRDAQARALRDQQRQVYDRAGMTSPIAPEPQIIVAPARQPDALEQLIQRDKMKDAAREAIRDYHR